MAIYYVDASTAGAWNGRDGSDHTGNEWLGLSGLQYAADTVTSGNIIQIKTGTLDATTLKSLTCDNQNGNFVRGEGVTWDGGSSTGVVSEISSNLPSVIEVTAGTLADNDSLTGATSGATADVNGTPANKDPVIDIDTNSGSGAYIQYVGVNASWAEDTDTYVTIDCNSGPNNGITLSGRTLLQFRNIIVREAAQVGWYSNNNDRCAFVNCQALNNGTHGFYLNASDYDILVRCVSNNNSSAGFDNIERVMMWLCSACNNGGNGFDGEYEYPSVMVDCVAHDNTGFNYKTGGGMILNCVSNETAPAGIVGIFAKNGALVASCRITNHATGLSGNSDQGMYGFNYFHDNTADTANVANKTTLADSTDTDTNDADVDADDGYNDASSLDFNLKADRTYNGDGTETVGLGIGS